MNTRLVPQPHYTTGFSKSQEREGEKCALDNRLDDERRAWHEKIEREKVIHESVVEGLQEELESKRKKCARLQENIAFWRWLGALGCLVGILSWFF